MELNVLSSAQQHIRTKKKKEKKEKKKEKKEKKVGVGGVGVGVGVSGEDADSADARTEGMVKCVSGSKEGPIDRAVMHTEDPQSCNTLSATPTPTPLSARLSFLWLTHFVLNHLPRKKKKKKKKKKKEEEEDPKA